MKLSALTPFGLKCRELRLAADRRLLEQAAFLGLEPSTITDYETGKAVPDEHYINKVAFWLRAKPNDLQDLLNRRAKDNKIIRFSTSERNSLKNSRKILNKIANLSPAIIIRLQEYRDRE